MKKGITTIAGIIGLLILLGYAAYLDGVRSINNLNNNFLSGLNFNSSSSSLNFASGDSLQIVGIHEDGFIVFNAGDNNVDSVYLIVDDKLVDFDLITPLPPLRAVLVDYDYESSDGVRALSSSDSDFQNIMSEYSGYFLELNSECDDNNFCTSDSYFNNSCSYSNVVNGQRYGCDISGGCNSDGQSEVICACVTGVCSDSCGNNICESWENQTSCLNDCNNCEENITNCSGVWFSGGVNISNGEFCACCGDDGVSDVFNNRTHFCSNGLVFTELDNAEHACTSVDYEWFSFSAYNFTNKILVTDELNQAFKIINADVDSDGDYDLITSSYSGSISWWKNNNGDWEKIAVDYAFATPVSLEALDFDSDSDLDLIACSESADSIYLLTNLNGLGTSWNKTLIYGSIDAPSSAHAVDLDSDGDFDVISTGYNLNKVVWFENINGNWEYHVIEDLFAGATSAGSADFDNNGVLDVFAGGEINDEIAWWGFNGTHWLKNLVSTEFNGVKEVLSGDLDLDGDDDLIATSYYGNFVAWLENNGEGSNWTRHDIISYLFTPSMLSLSDADNDGDLDVFGVSQRTNSLFLWLNNGDASNWTEVLISDSFTGIYDTTSADGDGDGDADVFATSFTNNEIGFWKNLGLSGVNGPCCGDDNLDDNFHNGLQSCVNGTII